MIHSVPVKFVALCLAALMLLGMVASAAGIVGLTALDLYDNSVEEKYSESMHDTRQNFAVFLVHRYASLELGHLPETYLNEYIGLNWMYNTFQYGYYFYTIRNEHGEIVESTMADAPEGGTRYETTVTNLRYRSMVSIYDALGISPEATLPPDMTTPPTQPMAPDATEAAPADIDADTSLYTAREAQTSTSATYHDSYFDHELGRVVEFDYVHADLPPYTVELYLLPGAIPEEYTWTLLREIHAVRYQLPWMLGGSALLLAALAVFLCCIAGRKKGREGARAGGLNRMPLEIHVASTAAVITTALFLLIEGGEYLLRYSPKLLVPLVAMDGYLACLSLVLFGFAFTAQIKTPDGFWWKNSLVIRCTRLVWQLARKLWETICCGFRWFCGRLARIYGLLPLIWQWLLTAGVLGILALAAGRSRDHEAIALYILFFLAVVIYGAGAFGILLESARRMSRGNLETKVSDRFLIGAFRTFAGHLNDLADVVSGAVQKQIKSERMKTELITNVSHDIKTPLTSIINYVDLLRKPHTPEEQEEYLEVLSRQSGQLKKLIDDLMEMSKASSGNISADIISLNAVETVNQALGEFSDKLEKARLTPVFRQPENPIHMKADGRLVWRVLSNLLSNVCKYALPGTRVYIDLTEQDGSVLISLKNISRQELNVSAEELMERFVRGDVSRNTEGSGLGLNIAQSLMELQKGQLQLTVDGDLFKVTLSLPAAKEE